MKNKSKLITVCLVIVIIGALVIILLKENVATRVWVIETVDSEGDVSSDNSLAVDSKGHPHICYYDYTHGDLKYAYWNGTHWIIEVVDSNGDVGRDCSIALDSNDFPHISYYDATNGNLKYAWWNGTDWIIETVDSDGDVGVGSSIMLDSEGYPHISYGTYKNHKLKYARWNGTSWIIETVDNKDVFYTSIALDRNNYPHIAYIFPVTRMVCVIKYARWNGNSWNFKTLGSGSGWGASLAVDRDNYPHICCGIIANDRLEYRLKYFVLTATGWSSKVIDSETLLESNPSLTLDSYDHPHICYWGYNKYGNTKYLKYASYNGYHWIIETIKINKSGGWSISLALDNQNNPHIIYYDPVNGDLKYVYKKKNTINNIIEINGELSMNRFLMTVVADKKESSQICGE